jgi:hypothetical protein
MKTYVQYPSKCKKDEEIKPESKPEEEQKGVEENTTENINDLLPVDIFSDEENDDESSKVKTQHSKEDEPSSDGRPDASTSQAAREDVVAQLAKIPSDMALADVLMLNNDILEALSLAIKEPEVYGAHLTANRMELPNTKMTFTKDDMLLNYTDHNRPLYCRGVIENQAMRRILIDPGSAVNIIPKSTFNRMCVASCQMLPTDVIISGFDQHAQVPLGTVTLRVTMGDFETKALFFVIDMDASYRAGRPWLHENLVVPSTLHQCFKYIKDDQEYRIFGEKEPFTCLESHMYDAKYYDIPGSSTINTQEDDGNDEPICRSLTPKLKDVVMEQIPRPSQKSQPVQKKLDLQVKVVEHAKKLKKLNIACIHQLERYCVDTTDIQAQMRQLTCLTTRLPRGVQFPLHRREEDATRYLKTFIVPEEDKRKSNFTELKRPRQRLKSSLWDHRRMIMK